MNNYNIILMLCNWGPHTAFQILQDKGAEIPPEVKMIRIPCTGRISKSLLFKAFEMGADGVALIGCEPGACRYGSGTAAARENTQDMREILGLLGLGKERLRLATFLPDDSELLLQFLKNFCRDIQSLGKSPLALGKATKPEAASKELLSDIISSHDVYACQDCGKCSSTCPLALSGKDFSPRALASSIIAGDLDSSYVNEDVWACLTCGLCYDRCPSGINFPEFIRDARRFFKKAGVDGREAHGGFFQSLMRAMSSPKIKTERWTWLPDNIKLDHESKVLFFGGCAPFFDVFFRHHLSVQTSDIIVDSLRLLNFFDIKPALLKDERCCGHDLLWSGDQENFLRLAKFNVDLIHSLGIKEVVTSCPECYRTLKHDYTNYGLELKFKVTHIYDFLEKEIDKGAVSFKKIDKKLTFQDPCRLSRLEQKADLPRMLIKRLKGDRFQEMPDSKAAAICCGNSAWTGCDSFSKALQVKRLRQAHGTGSDLLVTACPKCQIHLKCAMEDPFLGDELSMEMMDLTSLIAKTICWE
ncbi:MAG: hydrogenase iron-sulfur subunit [Desulfobacterales bacterium]|nr:hydrogenase iron-sulfur subunit [Desulfobacterales bacterium]